mgnify:CR=1 FL=1
MITHPTHKVVITIVSREGDPDVNMKVEWEPLMGDDEIQALGYIPACYKLAENFLFATEAMIDTSQLLEIKEGDLSATRSLN